MGACEIYPQTLQHSSNGRFLVACGDGEYTPMALPWHYTAMELRNYKAYGSDPSVYAVRESVVLVRIFKNFKEYKRLRPHIDGIFDDIDGIHGGTLLCVRSNQALCFYDWESLQLIRRVEISAKSVYWADSGELVAIATEESFVILKYNVDLVSKASSDQVTEDGIEDAFTVIGEQAEIVKTALWVGDCFIFTTAHNRLNYYVGGEIVTIAHLDRPLYLLGYIHKDSRLYACDKDHNVVSYRLLLNVLEYQTAVMRHDFDTADKKALEKDRENTHLVLEMDKVNIECAKLVTKIKDLELQKRDSREEERVLRRKNIKLVQRIDELETIISVQCRNVPNRLILMAKSTRDFIIPVTEPFIMEYINHPSWRYRDAAIVSLGWFLDGPDAEQLKPLVRQTLPRLIEALNGQNTMVRNSAVWCMHRMLYYCYRMSVEYHS